MGTYGNEETHKMERNRTKPALWNLPERRGKGARGQLAKRQTALVSDENPCGAVPMVFLPLAVYSLCPPMRIAALTDTLDGRWSHRVFWAVTFQHMYD